MPQHAELFRSHAVFEVLTRVERALDATQIIADEAGVEAVDAHSRLLHIVGFVKQRLNAADPLLAPTGHLNTLADYLARLQADVDNYRSAHSLSHLTQAATHGETAAAQAMHLPVLRDEADVQALQDAVVSFRRSLGQHLRHYEEQAGSANAELSRLRDSIASSASAIQQVQTRTDEAVSRFEAQFSQAEAERRREYQSALASHQQQFADAEARTSKVLTDTEQRIAGLLSDGEARLTRAVSEFDQRFQAAQEARTARFDAVIKDAGTELADLIKQWDADRASEVERLEADLAEYKDYLKQQKEEVEKLVGAVAQTGMVAGYQRVANSEQLAMRLWQAVTVVSIIGFVVLMVRLIPDAETVFSWPALIGRALAALGLAGLAAYAGRESAKHGEKERHLRQFELEIASLGPFLASVPKEDQDAIKKTIADRAFGRGAQPLLLEDRTATTSGLLELMRLAVTELGKRAK